MLAESLSRGEVFLVELLPPRGVRVEAFLERARRLWTPLVDAFSLVDMPLARRRVSPWAVGRLLRDRGMEVLVHFSRTSRNLPRLVGDALGCGALGLDNLLLLSGDVPAGGDYPDASRIDDIGLVEGLALVKGLNERFTLGAVFSPHNDRELLRARRKLRSGADFLISQPVFEAADVLNLAGIVPLDRIIVSVAFFKSHGQAAAFAGVPGIEFPADLAALADADDETVEAYTFARCAELVKLLRGRVLGFCISGVVKDGQRIAELAELAKDTRVGSVSG